jgi:hypothetical protein
MQVTQAPSPNPGIIFLREPLPALAIGRQVVATVVSAPKDGMVMVSMFGRRVLVETTLELYEGQVLNLRVHETTPRVIMKPVEEVPAAKAGLRATDALVERLVGRFEQVPVSSFDLREILKALLKGQGDDAERLQHVSRLVEEFSRLPGNTLAYLIVPLAGEDAEGGARVSIERDGEDYRLHFDVQTDALGLVEATVLRTAAGIHVEISSASDETAAFMRRHLGLLAGALEPLGVRSMEVTRRRPSATGPGVDMLV